ncbi:retrovirus-related Pol polyprotein from transposon RE1 [Trichonephila clavata]|uniref:Retrovirus-related Pol polyprotein from transposon RE1 n=1 Tax=Trichonephila clavata TaxID=2740835 RepID=A0A8X6H881_TRICU|nr:retrovirus-related Pol polyprotein from transposon RE1 [Trichonephila clavata]
MEVNNQIPVLTQNNWNTWKHDMQVILMHYGCWQFIIQTKPEEPDEGATYKEKKGIDFKPKTHGYPRLDLNFPDYDEEEDDFFDTVRDSLASRLVSKTSTETPTTSFEKPDLSSDNRSLIPCSEVKWIRNIGREVTGSNVYYGIEGTATLLRSFNEIERYCNKSNIQYDPSLFDFRKEDTESQEVNMVEVDIPNCYKQAIRSRKHLNGMMQWIRR